MGVFDYPIYESLFYLSSWLIIILWGLSLFLLGSKIRSVDANEALSVGGVLLTSCLMVLFVLAYWAFAQNSRLGFFPERLWLALSHPRYMLLVNLIISLPAIVILSFIKQKSLEAIDRETEQARELRVLYRVAQLVASNRDLARLYTQVLEETLPLHDMEAAWIVRCGEQQQPAVIACSGVDEDIAQLTPWLDATVCGASIGGIVVAGETIAPISGATVCRPPPGFYACLGVPLETPGGVAGYLFCATTSYRPLVPATVRLAQGVAALLGLAVESRRHIAQIGELAAQVERHRMADRVHDGLSHAIATLKLQAAMATVALERGRLDETRALIGELESEAGRAYDEARSAIDFLRVDRADSTSLQYMVESAIRDWKQVSGVKFNLRLEPVQLDLEAAAAADLIRILIEALTNIRKHAEARVVAIACRRVDDCLEIAVEDNGVGFDAEALPGEERNRWGLAIMRERARAMNADLTIDSMPGKGCRIAVTVPLGMSR